MNTGGPADVLDHLGGRYDGSMSRLPTDAHPARWGVHGRLGNTPAPGDPPPDAVAAEGVGASGP